MGFWKGTLSFAVQGGYIDVQEGYIDVQGGYIDVQEGYMARQMQ